MTKTAQLTFNTGSSSVVTNCQICDSKELEAILFLGYLPPVNTMPKIGSRPKEEESYPAELLLCKNCQLAQIGSIVDPQILFPPDYPYASGTTKILRENFAELYSESSKLLSLKKEDLIVDIGSNDGTLLSNFKDNGHQVQGIEPTLMGARASERGIPTEQAFFNAETARKVKAAVGQAKVITAANVFAHIENVHEIVDAIMLLMAADGVFISESHYLLDLIATLQYDTIYHEHLRYYSLTSLNYLFNQHGLEIIHAKRIPTHGGSIRVYAARKGTYPIKSTVMDMLDEEASAGLNASMLAEFREKIMLSKLALYTLLAKIKQDGQKIFGVGAPSRASTLVNYVGLDETILDCVVEIKSSPKIGKYMPGTIIPVIDEQALFDQQPDFALLLSWHIADELIKNLTNKGFKGKYIIPLPSPYIKISS
jgi:hypothetical protein